GKTLALTQRDERCMVVLARKCIIHAHAVNQEYFAARVTPESSALMEQIIEAIEDVSTLEEFPTAAMEEMIDSITPRAGSHDEIVPGWVALIDAVGGFVSYRNERDSATLFHAIADAYQSVSNRACAQYHGVSGNCGFTEDEKATEEANDL